MASRLIGAAVLLLLAFVLLRMSQPYIQSYHFEKLVQQELDQPRQRAEAAAVHRRVLQQGQTLGFNITDQDIQVDRLAYGYEVKVHYSVPVNLSFYRDALEFNLTARTKTELTQ